MILGHILVQRYKTLFAQVSVMHGINKRMEQSLNAVTRRGMSLKILSPPFRLHALYADRGHGALQTLIQCSAGGRTITNVTAHGGLAQYQNHIHLVFARQVH